MMMPPAHGLNGRRFQAVIEPPFPDESLFGFLTRALSHTAIRSLRRLLQMADAAKPNALAVATTLTNPDEIARIAYLFGCEPNDLGSRTYAIGTLDHSTTETIEFFGTKIRAQYREAKVRRVSPRALEIAPYHRAIWEVRPFCFDPATRENLLDSCPVCQRKLGWHRAHRPYHCDWCHDERGLPNVDLRDYPQPVVEIDDFEALDFVTGLVDPDLERKSAARKSLPARWLSFSNSDLFETVMALGSGLTLDPAGSANAQGRTKRNDEFSRLTPEILALAGRAVIGGDKGFAALADRYRADMKKRPGFYGRRKELGALAYLTYDRHLSPEIRSLLRDIVDANMRLTSRYHALRKGGEADDSSLAIKRLAREYKVRPSILRRLSKSGYVTVSRSKDAKRSPVRMMVGEILPLLAQMKDAIGENEAAGLLGLPLHVLPGLAERGLLDRLAGPVLGLVPGNAGYTRSSVDRLLESLWRRAGATSPRSATPLIIAARSIRSGEVPWGAIINAILAGEIEIFVHPAGRKSIRYSLAVSDVQAFADAARRHLRGSDDAAPPEWIGNATAAEVLKVTEAFVWRLNKARPDILKRHGNGFTPFMWNEVAEIARRYIFVSEVMDRADMHPRRACGWLKSQGLKPAFSLQDNKDLGFLRNEVEPLIAAHIAAEAERSVALKTQTEDLRTRLVKAVAGGAEIKGTARRLGVPYRKAVRWVTKWRTRGVLEAEKFGVKSPLDKQADWIRQTVARKPKISLGDLKARLAERGIKRSKTAIWNCLERHGIERGGRRREKEAA
jgi:transposase